MVPPMERASKGRYVCALLVSLLNGCCGFGSDSDDGCKSDKDCKGDRVCVAGACADPTPQAPAAETPPPPPRGLARPREPVATPQPAPQPQPAPRPAAQPACTDYYCTTRKGTMGLCKSGVCTDPCGPGLGFDPTDTNCHKVCSNNSQCVSPDKCNSGLCTPWDVQ